MQGMACWQKCCTAPFLALPTVWRAAAAPCAPQRMCEQCNVQTAVIGVPKSVDNDLLMVGAHYEGGEAWWRPNQ